jgi:hypothetical protein
MPGKKKKRKAAPWKAPADTRAVTARLSGTEHAALSLHAAMNGTNLHRALLEIIRKALGLETAPSD